MLLSNKRQASPPPNPASEICRIKLCSKQNNERISRAQSARLCRFKVVMYAFFMSFSTIANVIVRTIRKVKIDEM